MSDHTHPSHDCLQLQASTSKYLRENEHIPKDVVTNWMASPCLLVQWSAFRLLFEQGRKVEDKTVDFRAVFFEHLLLEQLESPNSQLCVGRRPDDFPSRFEIATYLYLYIEKLLDEGESRFIFELITKLGDLVRRVDSIEVNEAVLLGMLEHVLCDTRSHSFFEQWQSDPELKRLLREGQELANRF